jgi:hypothetical protein
MTLVPARGPTVTGLPIAAAIKTASMANTMGAPKVNPGARRSRASANGPRRGRRQAHCRESLLPLPLDPLGGPPADVAKGRRDGCPDYARKPSKAAARKGLQDADLHTRPDTGVSWTERFAKDERDSGRIAEITQHYVEGDRGKTTVEQAISNMLSAEWGNGTAIGT